MSVFQAYLVITLLIWAEVSVSGTTPELSTTTGDTINIPCVFGEGTIRNIFWYYNDGTGPQKILFFADGDLNIEVAYANRASLQNDYSTLVLKDIAVADEGTYRCDVDRQRQTAVININTKLNVFSLRPNTLPVIPSCTGADESSSCSIHDNQPFTLNCTLPNVYPVKDTELIWYHDRKHFPSIPEVTQNDDGTTDISRQIKILETGNFTCNATYLSANGRENTAVSVEARIIIIPPTDEPNTPDKNLTDGPIVGIALSVVTVLIVGILLCICYFKTRSHCCSKRDEQNSEVVQPNPEELTLLETSAKDGSKEGNAESSEPSEQPTTYAYRLIHEEAESSKLSEQPTTDANRSIHEEAESSEPSEKPTTYAYRLIHEEESSEPSEQPTTDANRSIREEAESSELSEQPTTDANRSIHEEESLEPSEQPTTDSNRSIHEEVSSNPTEETFIDDILMAIAVKMQDDHINQLGKELGFDKVEIERYVARNSRYMNLTCAGTLAMLRDWDKKRFKARERAALKKALIAIGLDHLADNFLSEEGSAESSKLLGTTAENCSQNEAEWKQYGGYMEDLDAALIKAELGGLVPHYKNYTPTKGTKYGQQQETATGPSAAPSPNRSDKREVTNEEITRLTKLLPAGKYSELCVNLGFGYDYLHYTLAKNFMDPMAAFKVMLQEWKNKDGYMADLDVALIKAELGGLVPEYKNYTPTKGTKYEKTSPTEKTDFDDIILAIAEKIPYDDINKLGKKLGFNSTAIEKYVATNSRHQNIISQGTLEMLRDWDNKQTKATERAALKKALNDAGLVRLADEFFQEEGSANTSTTEEPNFDTYLIQVAKKIPKSAMDKFGKKLGFDAAEIRRYVGKNSRFLKVKCKGTLAMLRDWDKTQTKATERAALKRALIDAGLVRLADDLFKEEASDEGLTLLSSSTATQGESLNSLEQIRVTEKQLRKLAGCLPAEYSKDVAIYLGVSSIEHENTQLQNPSIKDANFKTLMKWKRTAGGGKVGVLDKALKDAGCGGIVYKDV